MTVHEKTLAALAAKKLGVGRNRVIVEYITPLGTMPGEIVLYLNAHLPALPATRVEALIRFLGAVLCSSRGWSKALVITFDVKGRKVIYSGASQVTVT